MAEPKFPLADSRRATTLSAVQLEELKQLLGKLVASHKQVSEMMLLMVQDGLGAMSYGQYGGSTPNPTMNAVISTNPDPESALWARNNVAETDLAAYDAAIRAMHIGALAADSLRRKYTSANLDMRNRLDPTDFCRIHWFCRFEEGDEALMKFIPRRVVGDLCKDCNQFRLENGRSPEPLEVERFVRTGKWPHKLVDPKERKAV